MRTRVGGNLDQVRDNLVRLCRARDRAGLKHPEVEVQYIQFQHNSDEFDRAVQWFDELGVDKVTTFWGAMDNPTDYEPAVLHYFGPQPKGLLPRCYWPHFSMVIKWNGDVIPCCSHRQPDQYSKDPDRDPMVVGNVFDDGVLAVWNSPAYRTIRKVVTSPARLDDPATGKTFCHGCAKVARTNQRAIRKTAKDNAWEDLYEKGSRGRWVRQAHWSQKS